MGVKIRKARGRLRRLTSFVDRLKEMRVALIRRHLLWRKIYLFSCRNRRKHLKSEVSEDAGLLYLISGSIDGF